jgi:hypothetical protein
MEYSYEDANMAFTAFPKVYFMFIVFNGSLLGLSLINRIFINQMNQINKEGDSEEI